MCDCNETVAWADGTPPCDAYDDAADCPAERCRWGRDAYVTTAPSHVDCCIPRALCTLGCEEDAGVSLPWRYMTSMFFVLGSLEPQFRTLPERCFAVFGFVCVLIIEGAVAGVLSSILIRMGGAENAPFLSHLKQYL
jgi:hypothetical protein